MIARGLVPALGATLLALGLPAPQAGADWSPGARAPSLGVGRGIGTGVGNLGARRGLRQWGAFRGGSSPIGARARIGDFSEVKRFEARQSLRRNAAARERAHRARELSRRSDPAGVERFRRENEIRARRDELAARTELRQLDRFLARPDLGPTTRRILLRHRTERVLLRARLAGERAEAELRRELDAAPQPPLTPR